jgi:hypothetical protein
VAAIEAANSAEVTAEWHGIDWTPWKRHRTWTVDLHQSTGLLTNLHLQFPAILCFASK